MLICINFLLNGKPPSELHILNAVHCRARLLHLLDRLETLIVLARHLPAQEVEHADLAVGRAQRDELCLVRREGDAGWSRARLLELVQVRRRLEGPESRRLRRLPGFVRLPVLEEARGIGGEDGVVDVGVLWNIEKTCWWCIYGKKGGTRTARRCTGDLCSFSIVWRGIFGPRPSYMRIVGASLAVLYRGQARVQNTVRIHESRTLRAMPAPVRGGGPSSTRRE